jgi:hypothetical protein
MAVRRLSLYAAVTAACVVSPSLLFAQNGASPDRAAGKMVDALFEPNAPAQLLPGKTQPPRRGIKRPTLQAKLVRNANTKDGAPAFALVDRYGGILRYVEPVEKVKLEPYVGRVVGVRHDTGDTLLASQLILPSTARSRVSVGSVQQAAFQEPIPAGPPAGETLLEPTPADEPEPADETGETYTFEEGQEAYMGEGGPMYHEEGLEFGGCPDCESGTCSLHVGQGYRRGGNPAPRSRSYLHGEYLLWWFDGMDVPPLVTTSNAADGGVLPNFPGDNPSTVVIYGQDPLLEDPRSGFRVLLGVWLDDCNKQAIEGDYLLLGRLEEEFFAEGEDGNPIISRPFFDIFPDDDDDGIPDVPPSEAAEQVSSPGLDGSITITSTSEFQGAGIRLRHNLCRSGCADIGCGDCVDCGMGIDCGLGVGCGDGIGCGSGVACGNDLRYVDFLAGFRWYSLDEDLLIFEDLVVDQDDITPTPPPGSLDPAEDGTRKLVIDRFTTDNDFLGGELGFDWGIERNRWSLELLSKIAIGNNRQRVAINGSTQQIPPMVADIPDAAVGGLLAQSTNIGNYERDRFSMIPELNFNVGYKLTQRCKLRAGYTIMFWTNVVRPGDQIDREINSTLLPEFDPVSGEQLPPPNPIVGPLRPAFAFQDTNVLIQGLNVGMEYNW